MAGSKPQTVKHVDLNRYMGNWYEIASLPAFFQRGCQCTTANYTLKGSKVLVRNRCYKGKDYGFSQSDGVAWPVAGSSNSRLKVSFFWPFSGDYWILYLSKGYRDVIVGTPNRKYLWILSRSKSISSSKYERLVNIAKHQGYNVSRLSKTSQHCYK